MSRSGPSETPAGADDAFADLPGFDVIDGELVPREPGAPALAGGTVMPGSKRPAAG